MTHDRAQQNGGIEFGPRPDGPASCRTCGAELAPDATDSPFCSARCRLADLSKWFDGSYKISREIKDSDLETVD